MGGKRILLTATALSMFLAGAASAQTVGVLVVPVSPVKASPEIVSAVEAAFITEFPGAEILVGVCEDPARTQEPVSQTTAAEGWDFGAIVRLGVGKAQAGAAFAGAKMTVEAVASVEIATPEASIFNQEFNGIATGKSLLIGAPNVQKIYATALKEAMTRFQEAH